MKGRVVLTRMLLSRSVGTGGQSPRLARKVSPTASEFHILR